MKKISICKNQQIIFGHVVPTGAVYGKFTYNYTRRIVTGYSFVHDKNNQQVFNKNGTPKMRAIIKEVPTTNTVMYSVESFIDYSFKGEKERHLYAYVLFDNGKKWTEVILGTTPVTRELEKMVRDYIREHALPEPKMPHVKSKNVKSITPKFRQANQFDPVFRMRPENVHTINENVKPRMPIVHTNMDKLHPVDERPIYTPKAPEHKTPTVKVEKKKVVIVHTYKNSDNIKPESRKPARAGYHYAG